MLVFNYVYCYVIIKGKYRKQKFLVQCWAEFSMIIILRAATLF